MRKESIKSLTRKGFSQKKIAKTLGIRKSKVVAAQRKAEIGKRSKWGEHVRAKMESEEISYKEAVEAMKKTPYWTRKRLARMSKKELAEVEVPGFWKTPTKPKEELRGTFIEIEGIMYYEGE